MFKTLNNEFNEHRLIVIEDTAECNADKIFISLLTTVLKTESENSFLLCTETSSLTYTPKLPCSITCFDVHSYIVQNDSPLNGIFEKFTLSSIVKDVKQKNIFIDSVNLFVWNCGISHFLKDLLELTESGFHFIVRVHSDALIEEDDLSSLLYYCTAHIKAVENVGFNKFIIDTTLKKVDKKLLSKRETEKIYIEDDYCVKVFKEDVKLEKPQHTPVSINSLTTFNLGTNMSSTEKLARDQLVLPYLRTSETDDTLITYEADEADLEEDPDEDLEL